MESLITNLERLDDAIGRCLDASLVLPALALVYAGIDIVASLERQANEGTRVSFTRWVEEYLLPEKPLGVTSVELYAARCGILHTYTSDSDLSKAGKARRIFYAWGTAVASDLERTSNRLGHADAATVHVNDLRDAFREAVVKWFQDVHADANRRHSVESAGGTWFSDVTIQNVRDFLARS